MRDKLNEAAKILFVAAVCIAHIELYRHFEPEKAPGAAMLASTVFAVELLYKDERNKQKEGES